MQYDAAIIGGGPGGYVAAIRAAQLGGKVMLVERDTLGGVCLNKGCIPTKTLLKCSGMYKNLKNADEFGIRIENPVFDFGRMMDRKQAVVSALVRGVQGLIKGNGIELLKGEGKIEDRHHISVGGRAYEVKNIIIATGSRPYMPNINGIDSPNVMDSDALLSIDRLPGSIVIIGGGVIGFELAVLLSELGCRVTVLEMLENILAIADTDVIREAGRILSSNGVNVVTGARVTGINGTRVTYEKDGKRWDEEGEKVLVAVGRAPNTDITELDRLGIRHDHGRIVTDEAMRTNIEGIYAIGDVNGKYMLAHVASEEGVVAAENIFGYKTRMSYSAVPQCIYSHPEIAWVGLTEKEAAEKGMDVGIGKFPLAANGRSLAEGDAAGFVKVVADRKYGELLGVHMVCSHAAEMISEATLALGMEATIGEVTGAIHPHPTVSEALRDAALKAAGRAIHIL